MKIKHKAENCGSHPVSRDAYAGPALKVFGLVGTLTQGGTQGPNENNQNCDMQNPAEMC